MPQGFFCLFMYRYFYSILVIKSCYQKYIASNIFYIYETVGHVLIPEKEKILQMEKNQMFTKAN